MLMQNAHEGSPILEESIEVDCVAGYKLESFQQKFAVSSDNTHNPDRQCQKLTFRAFDASGNRLSGQSWVAHFKDDTHEFVTDH